jgi:hypothetical protein
MKKERIIYTLVLSIALIAIVGFCLPDSPSSRLKMERFWVLKTHTKKKFDIVIIGDSRVYRGLSPNAMKEILPDLNILNFGYSNGGLNNPLFLEATKKLDENSRKKIIVIGITPASLTPGAAKNEHLKQELRRKKTEVIQRIYLNPYFQFFEPTKPNVIIDSIFNRQKTNNYYEHFTEYGFVGGKKDIYNTNEALDSYRNQFKKEQVSEKVISNLIEQVKQWKSKNIMVFGYRPPSTEKMEMLENEMSGFVEADFIHQFEMAGGIWINLELENLKSYDGSHLDEESAERVSKELAKEIKILSFRMK